MISENKRIVGLKKKKYKSLIRKGKLDKEEAVRRINVQKAMVVFFREKLKRCEHDLWILNKNKYDPIKFPAYQ